MKIIWKFIQDKPTFLVYVNTNNLCTENHVLNMILNKKSSTWIVCMCILTNKSYQCKPHLSPDNPRTPHALQFHNYSQILFLQPLSSNPSLGKLNQNKGDRERDGQKKEYFRVLCKKNFNSQKGCSSLKLYFSFCLT
jgi:hypothetical protein